MIPHSRPLVGDAERAAVAAVIGSGHLSGGWEFSTELEARTAALAGQPSAVALSSGTAALEIALRLAGATGRPVVVPAYACLSVRRAVVRAGGRPELVDVDEDDLGLAAGAISDRDGTGAVALLVHQFGIPSRAAAEAASAGIAVVEDYTTALGGSFRGRPVGSLAPLGVVSMAATKMVCAGEGGVMVGGPAAVADARRWAHPESDLPAELPVPNARMAQLSAAVALAQLDRLPGFLARRRAIAAHYREVLGQTGVEAKAPRPDDEGTWWRFLVALRPSLDPDEVVGAAAARGVTLARPVPAPHWRDHGQFPVAERLHASVVSIPIYPALTDAEVEQVAEVAREVLARSSPPG